MKTRLLIFGMAIVVVCETVVIAFMVQNVSGLCECNSDDALLMSIGADVVLQMNLVCYFGLKNEVNIYDKEDSVINGVVINLRKRYKALSKMDNIMLDFEMLSKSSPYDIDPIFERVNDDTIGYSFEQRYDCNENACDSERLDVIISFTKTGEFRDVFIGKSHSVVLNNN